MLNAVRGNERLRAELLAALSEDRLPHSLLLAGEAGCGAGFAARCLAADYLFPQVYAGIESVLQEKGFEIVPISQLIHRENFEMDHEGRQILKGKEA